MADLRFFSNHGPFALARLAEWTGAELRLPNGISGDLPIADVAPLDRAGSVHVSFFDNSRYLSVFKDAGAGACFVRDKYVEAAPEQMALLVTADPYRAFAMVAQRFYPRRDPAPGVHPTAVIAQSAVISQGCTIGAHVCIGERVEIGNGCVISAGAVIEDGVSIGEDTQIGANSTISHAIIGARVILHRGVHIGQDGFGFAMGRDSHVKVPQLGRVVIGDDVEIGSGTCIDRGTGPDTSIGNGTKIDNMVQIGHNVQIGERAIIVSQVGIAGSTRIGDGAVLAGQVGIAGHLKIGAGARLAARSGVHSDIPPGAEYGGAPAVPAGEWRRQIAAVRRLGRRPVQRPKGDSEE